MITASISLWSPGSRALRADEPPAPLVARALARAGLAVDPASDLDRRRLGAAWLPSLELRVGAAGVDRVRGSGMEVQALIGLAWPLDAVDRAGPAPSYSRRRSAILDRLSALWRRREALRVEARREISTSVDTEIDLQETDAEIEALTGGGR